MGVRDRITKATTTPTPEPFRRSTGRASYPRRITLDLDDHRYDWLRQVAYDSRVPAAAILRAAVDALAADEQLLGQVLGVARTEHPAPGNAG
jgi:hypothetical protein